MNLRFFAHCRRGRGGYLHDGGEALVLMPGGQLVHICTTDTGEAYKARPWEDVPDNPAEGVQYID